MDRFRDVDPVKYACRQDGPNVRRYRRQVQQFGGNVEGIPRIEVTEGRNGELMINNGVTRAMRVFNLSPGTDVPIEVIDVRPNIECGELKKVRDMAPPE